MVFMGRGFTSGGQKSGSVFSAALRKIQASKCYTKSLPLDKRSCFSRWKVRCTSRSASDKYYWKTGSKNAGAFQRLINGTLSSGEFSKFLAKKIEAVGAHSASGFIDQWVYYRDPTFQVVASYRFVKGSCCTRTVRSHRVQEGCGFLLQVFVRPPLNSMKQVPFDCRMKSSEYVTL